MSPTLITKYSIFPLQSQFLLKTTRFRTTKKWVWKPKSRLYSITSAFCLNGFWHFENDSHLTPKFLKTPIIPYTLIISCQLSYLTTWSSAPQTSLPHPAAGSRASVPASAAESAAAASPPERVARRPRAPLAAAAAHGAAPGGENPWAPKGSLAPTGGICWWDHKP